jgi:hypothetical protein
MHLSIIQAYSQTWLPQDTLRIIYLSTPISHICTEQDNKHLLAFLLLSISTHAASYTKQTFLTLIPITKKERTPRASSKTHCIILHACPSIFLHLSGADRSSARHDLSMLLYHFATIILKARKKRTLPRYDMAMRTDAWFESRLIAHESSRRERQTASIRQQGPEGALCFLNTKLRECVCVHSPSLE